MSNPLARVGEDCFGELIRQHLERYKIQTGLLYPTQAMSTGIIVTVVDSQGENCGCRSFGANRILSRDEIDCAAAEQKIGSADAILIDDTIPYPAVVAAIRSAQTQFSGDVVCVGAGSRGRGGVEIYRDRIDRSRREVCRDKSRLAGGLGH
jgi:sugar/nucleoside kinase (ribokinase family)